RPYGDLVSNVESDWEDEAITELHNRNLRVAFTWMPAPSVFGWSEHRERQRGILEQAGRHFDAGELRVEVGATFPIERAADAHRALEAGEVLGKGVLLPVGDPAEADLGVDLVGGWVGEVGEQHAAAGPVREHPSADRGHGAA